MKKEILSALTNTKSITALVSLFLLLASTWGWGLPESQIRTTVEILCAAGVIVGVLNSKGMDTTHWNK